MKSPEKKRILIDCGTSYAKIHYAATGKRRILPVRKLMQDIGKYEVTAATGHNAARHAAKTVNELVALAKGGLSLIEERDFTLLDCGARDIKYIKVKDRKVSSMDWNTECGAFTGQVIDLLARHFEIDPNALAPCETRIPVVCGVLGMTSMFDRIANGTPHETAFSEFLRGVAFNCESLVGKPKTLYLSGGLCQNKAFLNSFSCEVRPLGRYVLLDGLMN